MATTASIVRNGEYILATDIAAPLIYDLKVDDNTPSPMISLTMTDFSGIGDFSLYIDGSEVVNKKSLSNYYNERKGKFNN